MADGMDRVLDELFASECPHELTDRDEIPCRECTRIAIAAAEERGRRRGVEERDELRVLLLTAQGVIQTRAPDMNLLLGRIEKALAPRDSGKEP